MTLIFKFCLYPASPMIINNSSDSLQEKINENCGGWGGEVILQNQAHARVILKSNLNCSTI